MKPLTAFLFFLLLSRLCAASAAAPSANVEAMVAEISARHPELAFYAAELDAARAGYRTAGSVADPTVELELGRKRVREPGGTLAGEGTTWSVALSQTFEWPGRIALRKAIANRDVALAELGLERFKIALAARVRLLAITLDAAEQKAAATREVANRFAALKEVFLARDPAGITPLLETRVLEAQELALQRRATDAALAAQAALVELNQLRGAPIDAPLRLAPGAPGFSAAPGVDALIAAARENHFEYRAKILELEQQGYAVRLARHERHPSITVSPFYSRENAGERESTFGIGVSVPLPLTSRTRNGTEAAEARRRQADAAVHRAEREMERDVVAAAQTFTAKVAETQRWSPNAIEKFREAAELADRHYRLGAVPLATYVELQSAYLDAVEALVETRREALDAGAKIHVLTGRSFITWEAKP